MNYTRVPFMNGYDSIHPGGGYLGATAAPGAPVKVILQADNTKAPGFPGFFSWLANAHPSLYDQIRVRFPNLSLYEQWTNPAPFLGASDALTPIDVTAQTMSPVSAASPSIFDQIVSSLSSLAPTVIATVDQQKIFNAQLGRAQSGLPPLNTSSYGLPSMQGAVSTLIWPVVIVGGGLWLLASRRRR